MNQTMNALALNEIKRQLENNASSLRAKELIRDLAPFLEEGELRRNLRDTTQARQLLDLLGTPPLPVMENMERFISKSITGELLTAEEIEETGMFLTAVLRVKSYLERGKSYGIAAAYYSDNLEPLPALREEIIRSVHNGRVDDYASNRLRDIRRELRLLEEKIKEKTEALLKSQKNIWRRASSSPEITACACLLRRSTSPKYREASWTGPPPAPPCLLSLPQWRDFRIQGRI